MSRETKVANTNIYCTAVMNQSAVSGRESVFEAEGGGTVSWYVPSAVEEEETRALDSDPLENFCCQYDSRSAP